MGKEEGKLGNLLGLLDLNAWDRLVVYLQSPWFNRSQPLRGLLQFYRAAAEQGRSLPADAEIFESLFPSEAFDAIKLKNLKAALQRKFDSFLAQEAFAQDETLQAALALRQLNVLGEIRHFARYHQKAVERIASLPIAAEHRELGLHMVMEEWEAAQIRLDDRSQAGDTKTAYHHAWQVFQLQTLRFLVRQANRGAIVGQGMDTAQAEQLLPMIETGQQALPTIQLYRALLDVFRAPQERAHFERYQALLARLSAQLAPADASDLYTGAINHCIRRINAGEADFATTMLALYQDMDRLDLLLHHGRLPAPQFKNMVGLALRFQQFEWAQAVILRYGRLLDQDPYGNAEAFNQGMLHFAQGEFASAERCFHGVLRQYDDVFFGLDARSYLLRIYYETDNWLGLESLAESFKMYLKRNKRIPKSHRESYLHTARFFGKLAKVQTWRRQDFLKLRAEIERTPFAATSKNWLLQKIDLHLARL